MEKLLTVKEASKILRVNISFVYALMKQGALPYLKLGSRKIRQADLDLFIQEMVGKDVILMGDSVEIKAIEEK